jgi:D-sedoheptulose 7-phosphate isomerase
MDLVQSYLSDVKAALEQLPGEDIWAVILTLHDARLDGRQVFILGNGGSAATASHFACDLGKGAEVAGYPGFRAIALTDNMATFSAYANDCGYEHVFARQLANLVQPGDVVVGISGSGNSANVLNAISFAHEKGAVTVGFVGFDGGHLKGLVDHCVHVENTCMEQVEDVHVTLGHLIATALRQVVTLPRSLSSSQEVTGAPLAVDDLFGKG